MLKDTCWSLVFIWHVSICVKYRCKPGSNGVLCEDKIDRCDDFESEICMNGGTCTEKDGEVTCQCSTGIVINSIVINRIVIN